MAFLRLRWRTILVAIALCFGVGAATSCTEYQKAVFRSLPPEQQQSVANYMNQQRARGGGGGSCTGAAHAVFPAHLHGWTDKIISRESGGNPASQNRSSSAAGCFQIVRGTWNSNAACDWSQRYDALCNAKTAWNIYQRSGGSPWVTNY